MLINKYKIYLLKKYNKNLTKYKTKSIIRDLKLYKIRALLMWEG